MAGNRPRVSWSHVRVDDVETLMLRVADSDLIVIHSPRTELGNREDALAYFRMQRRLYSFLMPNLRRRGLEMKRDYQNHNVRWAWLA